MKRYQFKCSLYVPDCIILDYVIILYVLSSLYLIACFLFVSPEKFFKHIFFCMSTCSCVVVDDRNQQKEREREREIHRQINEQQERKCMPVLECVCHILVGLWSLFICFSRQLLKCVCVCVCVCACAGQRECVSVGVETEHGLRLFRMEIPFAP